MLIHVLLNMIFREFVTEEEGNKEVNYCRRSPHPVG